MKKLMKLGILMILLLLNCSKSWCQDSNPSFTGGETQTDTLITINIDLIRKANEKLVEREYLIKEITYKDSLIKDYKEYINIQDSIISYNTNALEECDETIINLNNKINRLKNWNNIFIGTTSCSLLATILLILL